jgi:hypothetical protein
VTKQKDGEDDVVAVFQRETINLVPTTHRRKRSSLFLRFIGNEKPGDSDEQAGPKDACRSASVMFSPFCARRTGERSRRGTSSTRSGSTKCLSVPRARCPRH